ncbi:energy transducer TonB [Burkholderia cepacia]|uniref:Energy transducer TonB n=2 Tax=Burkholderiaceae TaxID=119060 RepID=A0A2S8IN48_BURCE|nr:energy transducer TonB [Burkholderia cepacia]TDA47937.1 energy transducer TonB [Burkholderia pyrrocinia]
MRFSRYRLACARLSFFYSHFWLSPMRPVLHPRVDRLRVAALAVATMLAACTITPPPSLHPVLTIPSITRSASRAQYRVEIAQRVAERNPSGVLHGTPQAMLRSLVVVAFTVDRNGRLVNASVYRSNGDSEAEALALASLRRSAPLPAPPSRLLDGNGQIEMMEGWLFNDDGHFQLQSTASAQAQSLD